MLGHPDARRSSLDLNPVIFNMLTLKGIYGREMYETWYQMTVMLQSGLDIAPGDHAPLLPPRLRGGVRRRPLRAVGQGRPRLDRHLGGARVRNAAETSSCGRSRRSARPASTRASFVITTPQGAARRRRGPRGAAQPLRATTTSAWPTTRRSSRPRTRRSTAGATAWPRCASSAARRRSTASSRSASQRSSAPTTRSSSARASTRTAASSRRCSARRTPSSPTSSTTPRSSTASGSARRGGCATRTATWTTSRRGSRRPPAPATG